MRTEKPHNEKLPAAHVRRTLKRKGESELRPRSKHSFNTQTSAHMHYIMSAEETQGGENGNSFIDY